MTECLLLRYAEEMPRVRALNVLDAAQSAVYAQLVKTREGGRRWWTLWCERAEGVRRAFPGRPIQSYRDNKREVKAWLRHMLGAGFTDERSA